MYLHVGARQKYLSRTAMVLVVGIGLVWASIYGVIVTRGFNQAFFASMAAYETISSVK